MANSKGGMDLFRTNDHGDAYYVAVTEGDGQPSRAELAEQERLDRQARAWREAEAGRR
jgi:hypothetical protein